jgi:hypothetical protein
MEVICYGLVVIYKNLKYRPPSGGFFAIVNNEKNHLKNDDKTKKTRIFG